MNVFKEFKRSTSIHGLIDKNEILEFDFLCPDIYDMPNYKDEPIFITDGIIMIEFNDIDISHFTKNDLIQCISINFVSIVNVPFEIIDINPDDKYINVSFKTSHKVNSAITFTQSTTTINGYHVTKLKKDILKVFVKLADSKYINHIVKISSDIEYKWVKE